MKTMKIIIVDEKVLEIIEKYFQTYSNYIGYLKTKNDKNQTN